MDRERTICGSLNACSRGGRLTRYGLLGVAGSPRPLGLRAHHRRSPPLLGAPLSAALFLGFDLTSPLHILHRCHNPCCFCPAHLHPGTHQESMRDRPSSTSPDTGLR